MAQMHGKRGPHLLERLGLRGGRAAILACMAIVVVLCGAGVALASRRSQSFGIERGASAAERASYDSGEGPSAKGEVHEASDGDGAKGIAKGTGQGRTVVVVHVDGAVISPGVFELEGETLRLRDAVDAAGGLAEGADTSDLNLAERLSDGQKVHVPALGENDSVPAVDSQANVGSSGEGASSGASASSRLVNINTAGAEELQTLSGIGEATARAIVEDRTSNGPFASPEDLMRVSGIGEKKFARLRGSICV